MANLFDYVKWRGDISFAYDPFNEVDNLLLAQLAYTDFEGCIPTIYEEASVTLHEIYETYYTLHTKEEILARTSFIAKAPLLMDDMKDSVRYKDIRFQGYINQIDEEKSEQMSAVQMVLPDGTIYVAYRGTDDTFIGWKEDLSFSYKSETVGQKHALQYLNTCFKDKDVKLRVGGHSKGGNFAIYASAFCDTTIKEKIIEVWSNDGPGFMHEVTQTEAYQQIQPRIKEIVPESSVIGMLLDSHGEKKVIKSDGKGIMQHDANTWQIVRNAFVQVEGRSQESILTDKTIRAWLEELSLEDRKIFVDTVFEILSSSGATTVSEFNDSLIKNATKIIKALTNMDKQQGENFKKVVFSLAKNYIDESTDSLKESIRNTFKNTNNEG